VRQLTLWTAIFCLVAALAVRASSPPNLEPALAAQRALAVERPNDAAVLNDLGNLLRLAGRLDEAEQTYRRSIELAADQTVAHFNLAVLLQQKGEWSPALKELRTVLRLDPNHAWAHYQVGMIEDSQGNDSRAVEAYARAFTLDPQLAFPEVNPHIIENRLLTAALIRSYQRGHGSSIQAPNAYADPGRIAALLVPPLAAEGEAPRSDEEMEDGDDGVPAPAVRKGREEGERPPSSGRVLSEEDLEAGRSLGQISPVGGGGSGARRGGTRGGPPPRTRILGATPRTTPEPDKTETPPPSWNTPRQPNLRQPGGVTGFAVPGVPGPPQQPGVQQPGGTRFRPGVRSTGQLNLQVLPPPPQRAG